MTPTQPPAAGLDLDEAARIDAEMTPRPWFARSVTCRSGEDGNGEIEAEYGEIIAPNVNGEAFITIARDLDGAEIRDADGIGYMRNHWPALIARAREAEALRADLAARDATIAELRAALGKALDIADEGWAYAEDYFRDKHLDTEQMARLRALANPSPTEG